MSVAEIIPFHPNQCPTCQSYASNIKRCHAYAVDGPLGIHLLAEFAGESSDPCEEYSACLDDTALKIFADSIRTSNTHYIKLAEAGAAENVVEKEIIYYLAALERKPTGSYSKNIVRGLDYAAKNGSDVIGMKDRYGFRSVRYPPPADEPQTSAEFGAPKTPLLSDDDARAAEQWYEKGYKAIYSGFQAQYEFYVKALQHNPNLAKAWHELQQACSEAGRYDLAERCDDAETILMSGKFIDNYRAVLEPETQLPAALATAPAISKATTPPSPGPKNADTRETRKWW
jgi:hypothetical protein